MTCCFVEHSCQLQHESGVGHTMLTCSAGLWLVALLNTVASVSMSPVWGPHCLNTLLADDLLLVEHSCQLQHESGLGNTRLTCSAGLWLVALFSKVASFSSSLTAIPSAAYRRFKFNLILALLSMRFAIDCKNMTRSVSVLMSSEMSVPGSYLHQAADHQLLEHVTVTSLRPVHSTWHACRLYSYGYAGLFLLLVKGTEVCCLSTVHTCISNWCRICKSCRAFQQRLTRCSNFE